MPIISMLVPMSFSVESLFATALLINLEFVKNLGSFCRQLGFDLDPDTLVRNLTIGRQQMVEIAKALSVDSRILIMDEPTSSLFRLRRKTSCCYQRSARSKGVSIIYISHRLGEVKELVDRVTVLRDGENAGHLAREDINHDNMVRLMVG